MTGDNEIERINTIAKASRYGAGVNRDSVRYRAHVFARFFRGKSCLEMGPAEGHMTPVLAEHFDDLWLVEGGKNFCDDLATRFPTATVINSLFEDFEPARLFDVIVLGHVLEHVMDPQALLRRVASWLAADGRVYGSVPNARSIHRQAAVMMGLLPSEHSMNDADRYHGHRRIYDPETLRGDFAQASLRVDFFGGYWLKPVSNAQIEETWTPDMIEAFMQLGERYPDIAAEIYVVASHD